MDLCLDLDLMTAATALMKDDMHAICMYVCISTLASLEPFAAVEEPSSHLCFANHNSSHLSHLRSTRLRG